MAKKVIQTSELMLICQQACIYFRLSERYRRVMLKKYLDLFMTTSNWETLFRQEGAIKI